MKLLAEYQQQALKLEQLAAGERDLEIKAALEMRAAHYRALAKNRAKEIGEPSFEIE